MGVLRNEISPTSHGKSLEELHAHHRPDQTRAICTWVITPATLAAVGLPGVLRVQVSTAGPTEAGRLMIARLAARYCVIEVRQGVAELHGPREVRRAILDVLGSVGAAGAGFADVQEVSFNHGRVRWRVTE